MALRPLSTGLLLLVWVSGAHAADEKDAASQSGDKDFETANVVVDGRPIMTVRGMADFPAQRRADEIGENVIAVAEDENIPAGSVVVKEGSDSTRLMAGNRLLVELYDSDAEMEGVSLAVLAETEQRLLQEALTTYRHERSLGGLLTTTLYAVAATLVAFGLLLGLGKGFRRVDGILERRLGSQLQALEERSARFIKAQQLALFLRSFDKAFYATLLALTVYGYVHFVLGLYPWTRSLSAWLFDLVLSPLGSMVTEAVAMVPNLIFLVVLYFVTRYALKLMHAFFDGIAEGAIKLQSFEQEWAWPTYRILRLVVIVLAVVVAYPYIPGSGSEAFKGITILAGLVFSLGSSSIIANIIAGYSLTYRRPFKIGDRVKINENVGDVMEIRVLVTRMRTLKNEEVVIPNTTVLNGEVINYTRYAREDGLILHTTVGIGYEVPWRQVEAMLKLAASRTPGLLKRPEPFVLRKELGDFAVNYELNVYCSDPDAMAQNYSALHDNILDVFNEGEVSIMTPAYIADPAEPKLVPKDQLHATPATTFAAAR